MGPSANAVEFATVTKRYGERVALDGVSFNIPAGCIFGLLGPNGAGKSTTLRLLTGILNADAGSIHVFGSAPKEVAHLLGFLPEERGLYKRMRILDQLVFLARLKGLSTMQAKDEARRWLQHFGLGDRASARCDTLSKGLSQKVQLIGTLLHSPQLVVLDEPFSGLDPVNVEEVRAELRALKQLGRTIVLSTHAMDQAEQLCDELMLVHQGRIVLQGAQHEVRSLGAKTLRLVFRGDPEHLKALPGLKQLSIRAPQAEIELHDDADLRAAMQWLVANIDVETLDRRTASLHDIFVRAVGE